MTTARCDGTNHRFAKFDDATIFCERCGEQRIMELQAIIAKLPPITYLPCPGPHYWQPYWQPPVPVFVWNDTGTTTHVSNGLDPLVVR